MKQTVDPADPPGTTALFGRIWRFAHDRHRIYLDRLRGYPPPWTGDPILRRHRFTNAWRAADRVSQRCIRLMHESRNESAGTILLRLMLLKIFNKEETFNGLVGQLGGEPPTVQNADFGRMQEVLDALAQKGPLYSGAYVMPGRAGRQKHHWHLNVIEWMLKDRTAERIVDRGVRNGLEGVYGMLKGVPGFGSFLAFQYAVDCGYGRLYAGGEGDFVVAGPGAADGVFKCFENHGRAYAPEALIQWMTEYQDRFFEEQGLEAPTLWGRALQPIDVQNLLCETSKYTRASDPEVPGATGRTRIKQRFNPAGVPAKPFFPPAWGLNEAVDEWYKTEAGRPKAEHGSGRYRYGRISGPPPQGTRDGGGGDWLPFD